MSNLWVMSKSRAILDKSWDFRCLEEIRSPPVPARRDHELDGYTWLPLNSSPL